MSQALIDAADLVSCMAYVDLNPIRAGMSESVAESEFTSIQERLAGYQARKRVKDTETWLKPLLQEQQLASSATLPIQEFSYFDLVDWTGRAIRGDKRGAIPAHIQPILQKLGVNEANWVNNTQHFGSRFHRALGRVSQIRQLANRTGSKWIAGLTAAKQFYQ